MKKLWIIATALLVTGYATKPHSTLGQIGIFLAGLSIATIAIIEAVRLYENRKESDK